MKVVLSPNARKALARSSKRKVISEKLHLLADNPEALQNNIKQLRGQLGFRLRIQNWRVIYVVSDGVIFVREILPRGSAYEDRS